MVFVHYLTFTDITNAHGGIWTMVVVFGFLLIAGDVPILQDVLLKQDVIVSSVARALNVDLYCAHGTAGAPTPQVPIVVGGKNSTSSHCVGMTVLQPVERRLLFTPFLGRNSTKIFKFVSTFWVFHQGVSIFFPVT